MQSKILVADEQRTEPEIAPSAAHDFVIPEPSDGDICATNPRACDLKRGLRQFLPPALIDQIRLCGDPTLSVARLIESQFEVFEATTDEVRLACHRLRYLMYCEEHSFEDPREHQSGLEFDEFDEHSVHAIAVHRATGQPVATVRLVLRDALDEGALLPFEQISNLRPPFPNLDLRCARVAEISRFGTSRTAIAALRERARGNFAVEQTLDPFTWSSERYLSNILLMLPIRGFVMLAAKYGVTHYCALTAPSLLRRLASFGVHFNSIGELVDHHGKRQPNITSVKALLNRAMHERVDVWSAISGNLFDMRFGSERVAAE